MLTLRNNLLLSLALIKSLNLISFTLLHQTFLQAGNFNGDISGWNTSNVKYMDLMLWGAAAFNQDIGSWDTSSVTSMSGTFAYASVFNADISSWSTGLVENMFAVSS
jgi:surface protein